MQIELPATRELAAKAAIAEVSDVTVSAAAPPSVVRYRAVVVRHLRQAAVVEFTARQGLSQWDAADLIADKVPEGAFGEPELMDDRMSVQSMEEIGPADDAAAAGAEI